METHVANLNDTIVSILSDTHKRIIKINEVSKSIRQDQKVYERKNEANN